MQLIFWIATVGSLFLILLGIRVIRWVCEQAKVKHYWEMEAKAMNAIMEGKCKK